MSVCIDVDDEQPQSASGYAWCSNALYATAKWQHFYNECLGLCLLQTPP